MTYPNSVLMLNILHRDFPDVADVINEKIKTSLPKNRIKNISNVQLIVNDFIKISGLKSIVWANSTDRVWFNLTDDEVRQIKVTEVREMLIAVVLMFFHPEKILGFTNGAAERGIIKQLAVILNCDKTILSKGVNNSVSFYKNYKYFKLEVDHLYNKINTTGKYFE